MENIYQKLLKIQQKINGLGKDKSAQNYKYVTGDKVLGEIKPLMNEMGLLLKQEIVSIENTRQDYKVGKGADLRDKSEINSKVIMRFTWVDCATGEKDENLFGANGQNDWDKGVGSALTYAERYFLLKYFHIATDEDDIDNPDREFTREPKAPEARQAQPQNKPAQPQQRESIPISKGEDERPWLNEKQLKQAIEKINGGLWEVYDKTVATFRMKRDYRKQLDETLEFSKKVAQ